MPCSVSVVKLTCWSNALTATLPSTTGCGDIVMNFTVPPARVLLGFCTVTFSVTGSPVSTRFVGVVRLVTVGLFCVRGVTSTVWGTAALAAKSLFEGMNLASIW